MKYICNVMQEGRCKGEVDKCNHRRQHVVQHLELLDLNDCYFPIFTTDKSHFCTEERFCVVQDELVHCVEVELFPAMKNPIIVSDELAKEFVEWVKSNYVLSDVTFVCDRLVTRFEEQLK